MKLGKKKEKRGAARNLVIRHRREGEDIKDVSTPSDTRAYIDVEHTDGGVLVGTINENGSKP